MSLTKRRPSIVYWLGNNLYLNITNQCSNNCYYCFRRYKNGIDGFNLKLRKEPSPEEVIKELQRVRNRKNWNEIIFCGFGEPRELKEAGVDKMSVSLNSHNEATYIEVCKPRFKNAFVNVLKFIENAGKEFDTEITTVTIPEVDISKVREMARKMGVGFRIREYVPCFW